MAKYTVKPDLVVIEDRYDGDVSIRIVFGKTSMKFIGRVDNVASPNQAVPHRRLKPRQGVAPEPRS